MRWVVSVTHEWFAHTISLSALGVCAWPTFWILLLTVRVCQEGRPPVPTRSGQGRPSQSPCNFTALREEGGGIHYIALAQDPQLDTLT